MKKMATRGPSHFFPAARVTFDIKLHRVNIVDVEEYVDIIISLDLSAYTAKRAIDITPTMF